MWLSDNQYVFIWILLFLFLVQILDQFDLDRHILDSWNYSETSLIGRCILIFSGQDYGSKSSYVVKELCGFSCNLREILVALWLKWQCS